MEQMIKLRRESNTLHCPKWCLEMVGNADYFRIAVQDNSIVFKPLIFAEKCSICGGGK